MKTIGVGVIGWGFMGQTHTHAVRSIPLFYPDAGFRAELRYVCSRNAEKARAAKDALGFSYCTDDYRALINCPEVDAVSICTPNNLHEEMAVCALAAGKHVYLDKPMSTSYASAERIRAAQGEDSIAQMAFHNRFFPSVMRAKAMISEGRLGDITSFDFKYLHSGAIDPSRLMGWKQGADAGVLHDLGSHVLDLAVHLLGAPESVFCALRTLYPARPTADGRMETNLGDDQALMMMRLPGGAIGALEASKIATGAEDELSFYICGTKGALKLQGMDFGNLYYFDQAQKDVPLGGERGFVRIATGARYPRPGGSFLPPKNQIGWDRAHIHCYYSFLECVSAHRPASPSLADGARVQLLMEKMAQSNEEGRWVDVPHG
jgi:predicted dehydrogenase